MVLYLEIWKLNFEKWEPPTEGRLKNNGASKALKCRGGILFGRYVFRRPVGIRMLFGLAVK